jgi:hypothetical protein
MPVLSKLTQSSARRAVPIKFEPQDGETVIYKGSLATIVYEIGSGKSPRRFKIRMKRAEAVALLRDLHPYTVVQNNVRSRWSIAIPPTEAKVSLSIGSRIR